MEFGSMYEEYLNEADETYNVQFEDVKYTITHSLNKKAHTDTASVSITGSSEFGSFEEKASFVYQYDRSSDLWTLISANEWEKEVDLDENSFIGYWMNRKHTCGVAIYEVTESTVVAEILYYDGAKGHWADKQEYEIKNGSYYKPDVSVYFAGNPIYVAFDLGGIRNDFDYYSDFSKDEATFASMKFALAN